jgi:hypothetical protein
VQGVCQNVVWQPIEWTSDKECTNVPIKNYLTTTYTQATAAFNNADGTQIKLQKS